MPTRREFLLNCSAAAVAVSVAPATAFGAPWRMREVPLGDIRMSVFAASQNAAFQVEGGPGTVVVLQLIEVQSAPASAPTGSVAEDAANEKFSLLFQGPLQSPLEQSTYWFETQGIGRFAMFIVPIGSTENTHFYYEAIFNRPPGGPLPEAGQGNIPVGGRRNQRQPFEPTRAR